MSLVDPHVFLTEIFQRPPVFGEYTADRLWQDDHISQRMLELHLDQHTQLASRPRAFIERSAEWIGDRFELDRGSVVFDYGCGPGLYASRFAKQGADVTGIDFSRRSIQYAAEFASANGIDIEYILNDYLAWEASRKADLITLIFCDLCALSPNRRRILFDRFRQHLKPGGHILLDVCSLAMFQAREEKAVCEPNLLNGFFSNSEYFGFQNSYQYEPEKVSLDKYTIVQREGVFRLYNWLQHYDVNALTAELSEHGFTVCDIYSSVAGDALRPDSPIIAVVAQAE